MSEAERLADDLDAEFVTGRISNHTGRKAAAELRRLSKIEDEVEALRKDAERYCYLRDHGHLWQFAAERGFLSLEVDAAIDAAMIAARPGGGG